MAAGKQTLNLDALQKAIVKLTNDMQKLEHAYRVQHQEGVATKKRLVEVENKNSELQNHTSKLQKNIKVLQCSLDGAKEQLERAEMASCELNCKLQKCATKNSRLIVMNKYLMKKINEKKYQNTFQQNVMASFSSIEDMSNPDDIVDEDTFQFLQKDNQISRDEMEKSLDFENDPIKTNGNISEMDIEPMLDSLTKKMHNFKLEMKENGLSSESENNFEKIEKFETVSATSSADKNEINDDEYNDYNIDAPDVIGIHQLVCPICHVKFQTSSLLLLEEHVNKHLD